MAFGDDSKQQCKGMTAAGSQCRRQIPTKHEFCPQHNDAHPAPESQLAVQSSEEQQAKALAFRRAGLTYHEIGIRLDTTRANAHLLVQKGLTALASDPLEVAEMRALERSRLEALLVPMFARAARVSTADPDYRASEQALRIIDRLVKLDGLNAPVRHELSGAGGGPIQVADVTPALMQNVAAELQRRQHLFDKAIES